jgi:5-formyltetrahydrofolate cyclo-ligase
MAETTQWEYLSRSVGSFWNMPKDEDLEAVLNELGEQGWEVVNAFAQHSSNKVRVIAKRPLTADNRRRRNWPG